MENNLDHVYEIAKKIIRDAGQVLKEAKVNEIETKTTYFDLVTEYDRKIEKYIIDNLYNEFPDHKFIGEETAAAKNSIPELTDAPTWIIDPIDGTINFVHSFPMNCISIGLTIQKQIVIGIVYCPHLNQFFSACKKKGAYLNDERIYCSKTKDLKSCLMGFELSLACHSKFRDLILAQTKQFVTKCRGVRSMGSAALMLCYVAKGSLDAYQMDYLKPWDVAAGVLIIEEAGGIVKGSKGDEFNLMKPSFIVAGTEELALEVLECCKRAANEVRQKE